MRAQTERLRRRTVPMSQRRAAPRRVHDDFLERRNDGFTKFREAGGGYECRIITSKSSASDAEEKGSPS